MNPKPGALTAIQVILFIMSAIAGLALLLAVVGVSTVSSGELESATGVSSGTFWFLMLVAAATTALYVYVASTLGRGGYRTRTLVRVVAGVGVASALINMLSGESGIVGLVLMVVVLTLNEGESARRWYEETENPASHRGQ
ncbi:hypothetical protein [Nocardiopsis sp. B62]|jgi:hypothetical protein|uniref:hypothetical protein n=1 Tax=Nocardiopsis sp. B62 TaxID=2824874 RepID=UPI001B36AB8F|nr:hypothetical protein [Nocardiopsis sp. B62]MBQ1080092.1 hypothetical protein [Nocardiopsis sp. B62]